MSMSVEEMGRKGGIARAASLSKKRRREIAMMGVAARLKYANDRRRDADELENTCQRCGIRGCMGQCAPPEKRKRAREAKGKA